MKPHTLSNKKPLSSSTYLRSRGNFLDKNHTKSLLFLPVSRYAWPFTNTLYLLFLALALLLLPSHLQKAPPSAPPGVCLTGPIPSPLMFLTSS